MWKRFCGISVYFLLVAVAYGQEVGTDADRRYSVEIPKGWTAEARKDDIDLKRGQVTIHIYPASDKLASLDAVIDDITQYYNKRGIPTGPKQRLAFPGGEALWVEAPGTERPYLGAVSRGGKFFFVNAEDKAKNSAGILEAFLAAVRSVRPPLFRVATPTSPSSGPSAPPTASARSDPWKDGEAALESGRDDEALRLWRPLAEVGNAEAQYRVGSLYRNPLFDNVPQDPHEASKWFRKAAEQGHARAQNALGGIYRTGDGVLKDYAEALKWYRKAADQGNADAEVRLGYMYFRGEGVPKDHAEALKWFRKAVDQGGTINNTQWSLTALELADMYRGGDGTPRDYVEADKWYRLVAETGETAARKAALRYHEALAAKMTPAELAEAEKRAQEWKPKRP